MITSVGYVSKQLLVNKFALSTYKVMVICESFRCPQVSKKTVFAGLTNDEQILTYDRLELENSLHFA